MDDTPLIDNKTKTPTHTLIRVRNNQRRHRQRRRDYIESLERKLETMEQKVRQLGIENEALRRQLSFQGTFAGRMSTSTTMAISDMSTTTHFASTDTSESWETWDKPSNTRRTATSSPAGRKPEGLHLQSGLTQTQVQVELNDTNERLVPVLSPSFSTTLLSNNVLPSTYVIDPPATQSPIGCCSKTLPHPDVLVGTYWPGNRSSRPLTNPLISTSSTVQCSQAYIIIQHQNRRRLSWEVIEHWLWPGFIYGDGTAEGACRVDSRLLLELLVYVAEVSDIGLGTVDE